MCLKQALWAQKTSWCNVESFTATMRWLTAFIKPKRSGRLVSGTNCHLERMHQIKALQPSATHFPDDTCRDCLVPLFAWVHGPRKEKEDAEKDRAGFEVKTSLTCEHMFHSKCLTLLFGVTNSALVRDESVYVTAPCPTFRRPIYSKTLSTVRMEQRTKKTLCWSAIISRGPIISLGVP